MQAKEAKPPPDVALLFVNRFIEDIKKTRLSSLEAIPGEYIKLVLPESYIPIFTCGEGVLIGLFVISVVIGLVVSSIYWGASNWMNGGYCESYVTCPTFWDRSEGVSRVKQGIIQKCMGRIKNCTFTGWEPDTSEAGRISYIDSEKETREDGMVVFFLFLSFFVLAVVLRCCGCLQIKNEKRVIKLKAEQDQLARESEVVIAAVKQSNVKIIQANQGRLVGFACNVISMLEKLKLSGFDFKAVNILDPIADFLHGPEGIGDCDEKSHVVLRVAETIAKLSENDGAASGYRQIAMIRSSDLEEGGGASDVPAQPPQGGHFAVLKTLAGLFRKGGARHQGEAEVSSAAASDSNPALRGPLNISAAAAFV